MQTTSGRTKIFWLEPDRFDLKPNKSPWLEMANGLHDRGFDVTLVTGIGKEIFQVANQETKVVCLRSIDTPFLFRYVLLARMLLWLLGHAARDSIVIMNPGSLLIAPFLSLFGIKNLHMDVRTVPVEIHSFKRRIERWLLWKFSIAWLSRFASSYSFITKPLKDAVEEEFGLYFNDFVLWQSGVNTSLFRPAGTKEQHSNDIGKMKIIYHGTISRSRGLDRVIEAIYLLPDDVKCNVQFTIIGSSNYVDSLKLMVKNKKLEEQVFFKGLMPYETMPEEVHKADFGIYPLPDRPEWNVSSPLKVFEYMACAKPVILTPIPAHKEIVADRRFVVWSKGDGVLDLRDAILEAFKNRSTLLREAEYAPSVAKEHEWKIQSAKLADYLSDRYSCCMHQEQVGTSRTCS